MKKLSSLEPSSRRQWLGRLALGFGGLALHELTLGRALAQAAKKKAGKVETPPPTKPPLEPITIAELPSGQERVDLFLLLGQSNMKGRGVMPTEPSRDPRIAMMALKDDGWYVARDPLHLTGDPKTFAGADNAGVGPGMAFARAVLEREPKARVALIPGAVGGTSIARWQKGARLYDPAIRRAKLALQQTANVGGRLRAVLWLQGEADANDERLGGHEAALLQFIDDLRTDLGVRDLPFIACTIGEMRTDQPGARKAEMNRLLLSLPQKRPNTACVDARDLTTHIGDGVHFDTPAQNEIGRRFAERYWALG